MAFPLLYESLIERIVALCPAPDKFAHVFAGLAIWLLAALLLRRPLSSRAPLLAVALLELANEGLDRLAKGSWQWPDTLGDAAATLFWPVVLFAALAVFPWLGKSGRTDRAD